MVKTENREPHNKATRTMRNAAMLLLLREPLMDAPTFCAFKMIRKPTIAEKRRRKQRSLCERKELVWANIGLQMERGINFFTLYIKRDLVDQLLGYRGITVSNGTIKQSF
jgi:hypothetical protein